MFYEARHKRSFWKSHANDLIMVIGMALFFGVPVFLLFTVG